MEVLIFLFGVVGVSMVLSYNFLLNILYLLSGSLLLFIILLFSNNLLFGLIVMLVYVGGILLLFMYVSTMLSIWEEDLGSESLLIVGFLLMFLVWDLLSYSVCIANNTALYSMCTYIWFYVIGGSIFLALSLFIMVNMLAANNNSS